jgi:nitroreductase
MEAIEAIYTRGSVRKYKQKEISDDIIKMIIKAGMQAPSAGNEQPWQFLIIKDKNILNKIPKINPYAAMTKDAMLGIMVLGDLSLEKFKGFWVQDCSACVENILLSAHALGLGAVWTAIYGLPERVASFKKLFGLPENVIPFAFIPLGYPDQGILVEDRFNEQRIHYNKWV